MTEQKYFSKIEFNKQNNSLDIEIKYGRFYTKREEEQAKDSFHWMRKQRGYIVARDDIQVHPKSGDIVEEIAFFQSQIGKEIYIVLLRQKVAPYVFPLLINDLNEYEKNNADKIELVKHTINELERIIEITSIK